MEVRNRRVTVMGLGTFGGGIGVTRFLARQGARVTLTDLKPAEELGPSLDALADAKVAALHLGGHREDDFTSADLVVASPAVSIQNPYLALARERGVAVTSEVCLFFQFVRSPILGVTGSNGKSTTAALIHALLSAAGHRAWLGGNLGGSLLESLDKIAPEDPVVLELSSFQLEYLAAEQRSPHLAVITNFTPNHLDHHGTLQAYRSAKQNILRFQAAGDWAVLNHDDPDVRPWPVAAGVQRLGFGLHDPLQPGAFLAEAEQDDSRENCGGRKNKHVILYRDQTGNERTLDVLGALQLPGQHNVANTLAAVACVAARGVEESAIRRGLAEFRGLPHRLERVAEIDGRIFYNDSIATTPESTCAALDSFEGPILLIAGGYEKGIDLQPLTLQAAQQAKAVALIGQTGPDLLRHLDSLGESLARQSPEGRRAPVVTLAGDLETAVTWAWQQSCPGDVIVLSPGCASYDQFRNFEHRGSSFRDCVHRLREVVTG